MKKQSTARGKAGEIVTCMGCGARFRLTVQGSMRRYCTNKCASKSLNGKPAYEPSPEDIESACLAIRREHLEAMRNLPDDGIESYDERGIGIIQQAYPGYRRGRAGLVYYETNR